MSPSKSTQAAKSDQASATASTGDRLVPETATPIPQSMSDSSHKNKNGHNASPVAAIPTVSIDLKDKQAELTMPEPDPASQQAVPTEPLEPLAQSTQSTRKEPSRKNKTKRRSPTKAELEVMLTEIQTAMTQVKAKHEQQEQQLTAQVDDLQVQLDRKQQSETDRQTQVNKLQAQLQEYKDYVEKIKTYLEQASKLKEELDRVRQENIQLAETNQKLTTELANQKNSNPSPRQAQAASPRPKPANRASRSSMIVRRSPTPKRLNSSSQGQPKATPTHTIEREILNRPIMPNRTPPKINDANIGWVD
ncbi:hypothetical protein Pse7367_2735 [Thalassoporum mexicanum PCC 7367]|uniref:hypothetical protein n=1 Tax=Thalassoporum mexicanum TaxID=3457544 RepID=UPI00029F8913|nr:hypothetical protein [Pseudanabaena sp. PCC 7367]AFY70990.1 hypothetical protein Pse7367_2735 [Pseudanabaena sp. PCC 7367]